MSENRQKISIPISGMSCDSCVGAVEKALTTIPGVSDVVVSLRTNRASLCYDPWQADIIDMKQAIESVGYHVPSAETTFDVQGMTCTSCIVHVEGALVDLPGVETATVNLGLGIARVNYVPDVTSIAEMKQAVKKAGYETSERGSDPVDALDRK